jgi:hypothetical protein
MAQQPLLEAAARDRLPLLLLLQVANGLISASICLSWRSLPV